MENEEKTIELDEQTQSAIADKVSEGLGATVKTLVDEKVNEIEATISKKAELKGGEGSDDAETKEMKLVRFVKAMRDNDFAELSKFKAMNETTDAQGGYLVPPAEFIAEVQRLEEGYGVALANANVRRTSRTSVLINKKDAGVEVYETAELASKTLTGMTFQQVEVSLRKYAGIAPLSDELDEDSAVNVWNELTTDFARAFAKKQDEIMFNDTTYGITKISGTNVVTITGGSIASLTFDNLIDAVHGVPTDSMSNGKFYFHRSVLGTIKKIKDENNNYIWQPGPNGSVNGTIWGYPYVLTEVLTAVSADALNTAFIVFGDLKYYTLVLRNVMTLKVLEEGTVGTGDDAINLGAQDAKALRAVQRMDGRAIFASAFSVIKTAAVS